MKIAVIGTGYVGLVTGTCLAYVGHQVNCVDIDQAKVQRMKRGEVPIYEPGLDKLFEAALNTQQLNFTTKLEDAVNGAGVVFLALPTPPGADGSADLSAVLQVADQLGPLITDYTVIVNKSTVPVGTAEKVSDHVSVNTAQPFDVVSNPEFLREGFAVEDFLHPDRIVIGTSSKKARATMRLAYEAFVDEPDQLIFMDARSAELTKYVANAFLAMKVSFINEVANLCELLQTDIDAVRSGISPDSRIGKRYMRPGVGYGGSCLPKDVQALRHTSEKVDYNFTLLKGTSEVNTAQKERLFTKLKTYYQGNLKGKHFALWGLAFKADTDDVREAPALGLIQKLLQHGATVTAYDPQAAENAQVYLGEQGGVAYAETAMDALKDVDALLVTTEWQEFRSPDFDAMRLAMKAPVIFDGRNIYSPKHMQRAGFHYESIGRATVNE